MQLVTGDVTTSGGVQSSTLTSRRPSGGGCCASLVEHHQVMFLRRAGLPPLAVAPTISGENKLSSEVLPETFTHPKLCYVYRTCEESSIQLRRKVRVGAGKGSLGPCIRLHLGIWGELREHWPARSRVSGGGHQMLKWALTPLCIY